ncbi:MutS-related protein [Pleomorphovibrio marinus]|uniref:MutS-related protein n=1 Tax=Pleomorphovibrio marinus TaxID=2164132 RepID=UPI000E0B0E21|nr:DNA mismatch repair protein MutS [Pleomorphovibrio marinus]
MAKIYQTNIETYNAEISDLDQAIKKLSLFRLASFLGSLILITALANERLLTLLWIVAPLCVFGFIFLLVRYNQLIKRKETATFLKKINQEELLKFANELTSFPTGQSYLNRDHAYIADLDVFGSHSLFQLLNRTTTESGSLLLAKWLSEPAPKEVILERQKAIRELKPNLEWRQQLQVAGLPFMNRESDFKKLLKWFDSSEHLLPKQTKYLIGSITLAVSSTVLAVLYVVNSLLEGWNLYLPPLLIVVLINVLLLRKVAPFAEEIIDHTDRNVKILGGFQMLAQTILSEKFQSKILKKLRSKLDQNGSSAAIEIKKLKKILEAFQLRGTKRSDSNKFYLIFNYFWLFDIYWIILTERWKDRNRDQIQSWIRSISEFEVLNSLAGFAYSNSDFVFPEIKEEHYSIHFESLGHPLIKSESRVCNHFNLKGRGQIAMITGSNMAGKSTFLRTVGVNLILALMGAPCCAKSGQVSQMKMFTSMRTQDNLEEGVSSFYAELKRVEQLLALIKSGQPIFFMMDEMFKGTNSEDRYKGGVSLIKQLNELNAFGIISTHDLELARLAGNHMIVSNHSFNSKIIDEKMSFNYTLQDGICTDFNASELMKKCGINILANVEKMR